MLVSALIGLLANYSSSIFDNTFLQNLSGIAPLFLFALFGRTKSHLTVWLPYFAASSFTLPWGAGVFFGETAYAFALGTVSWIAVIVLQGYYWAFVTRFPVYVA
jgi:hypothetical protein